MRRREIFYQTITRLSQSWQQDGEHLKQVARAAAREIPAPQEAKAEFAPQVALLYRQRLVE